MQTVKDTFASDVVREGDDSEIKAILLQVCHATRMGFVAVARVTEDRWVAAQVLDRMELGLNPGDELNVKKTLCNDIRKSGEAIIIDRLADDPTRRNYPIPALFGFQSYASLPILLEDGTFYGTLCALDREPRLLGGLETVAFLQGCANRVGGILSAMRAGEACADGPPIATTQVTPYSSLEAFFEVIESLGECAWQRNLETDEIRVSDKFWKGLGYEPDVLPFTLDAAYEIVHSSDAKLIAEEMEHIRRSGEPFEIEYRQRDAEGEWRFVRLRGCVCEWDDKGEPLVIGGIAKDITAKIVAARAHRRAVDLVATLSKREREVVSCLVAGAPNKNIAYGLGLSQRTVEGYRARIMEKLEVRGAGDLVQLALEGGVTAASAVACGLASKANSSRAYGVTPTILS